LQKYDVIALLGSQVMRQADHYVLAPHTELKANAAGAAWAKEVGKRFVISGGYNWGVRYDDKQILPKPDYSFEAFTRARRTGKSEAEIIRDFMREHCGVPEDAMLLEEVSATTEENAEFLRIILERPAFSEARGIAILTLIHHMERALPAFRAIMEVDPLHAEDLLAMQGPIWIDKICEYYEGPKEGKQWDTEKIRELLTNGKSIGELLEI